MRWSNLFTPTLRDAPGDAEAASHKLLIRAGFMRQLHSGHYSLLPLGHKVHEKIAAVVRDEMNGIGAQEFTLPMMHPASLWKATGRWETMGDEMFRLTDRKGADLALGMTEEEVFTTLALELNSYKELPQAWYQIHTKFRDEPRPKSGLLRVREFVMKDSYSFDIDEAGLDASFDKHEAAYVRIFDRLGLPAFGVQASSGAMGGSGSIEFMIPATAGEDDVIRCTSCDYAANVERATSALAPIADEPATGDAPVEVATPDIRTVAELAEAIPAASAINQIKTMVMVLRHMGDDGNQVDRVTLALVRGDHQLNEQKLADATGAIGIRPANPDETVEHLGARPGSLGAVGVSDEITIVADHALAGRSNLTTGANRDDFHLTGVDIARDIDVGQWSDLRTVTAGEPCIECGSKLEVVRCIEAAHIFKLGTKYSEPLGANVLDENGKTRTISMGSYGIGIGRAMAAAVETFHDDGGMRWPLAMAPFEAVVTIVNMKDDESVAAAETIYTELRAAGVDAIIDDRAGRPGPKFKDAELIGIPHRITLGPKALADGEVEYKTRGVAGAETDRDERVPVGDIVAIVTAAVQAER